MTTATAVTFEQVSRQARPYPSWLLPNGTALAVFAAGFHGWNDCVHFARRGLACECVDVDEQRLLEMQAIYPDTWEFTVADAWAFAEKHAGIDKWDVVSVDPFLGDAAEKVWKTLYLWTALARHMLTITVTSDAHFNVPEGWDVSFFPRSPTAAWMVLRRD
jgi:hypothetical protein